MHGSRWAGGPLRAACPAWSWGAAARLILPAAAAAGCVATVTREPPDLAPRRVAEVRAWQVVEGEERLGRVVLLRIEDPARPEEVYRVENAAGQWAGWIDRNGRVFRREPFQEADVLVGTTTVARGAALLLGARGEVRLLEIEGQEAR